MISLPPFLSLYITQFIQCYHMHHISLYVQKAHSKFFITYQPFYNRKLIHLGSSMQRWHAIKRVDLGCSIFLGQILCNIQVSRLTGKVYRCGTIIHLHVNWPGSRSNNLLSTEINFKKQYQKKIKVQKQKLEGKLACFCM